MRAERTPKQIPHSQGQRYLNLGPSLDVKKPKTYTDYPYEERVKLLKSIRDKQGTGASLTDEEKDFQEADAVYWREGDQSYGHKH